MPILLNDIKENVSKISDMILEEMKKEVLDQGHKDTGKLINSMRYDMIVQSNAIEVTFYYVFYGRFVNDGVKASKVRYPIKILIDWFKRKGLTGKNATSAAWATRAKHKKEGIPTKKSVRFSSNGRRKGFQDQIIKTMPKKIEPIIDKSLIDPLKTAFIDMLSS